jgi:hypothetical protein
MFVRKLIPYHITANIFRTRTSTRMMQSPTKGNKNSNNNSINSDSKGKNSEKDEGGQGQQLGAEILESKLHMVDLAGSERLDKTGSVGGLLREASHINKSLSFLGIILLDYK